MDKKTKTRTKKSTPPTATIRFSLPEEYVPLIDARCQQLQVLPNRSQYLCELVYKDLEQAG